MKTRLKKRIKFFIAGTVQGVGFRPFVYRCAKECGLNGYVSNTSFGADVEVEGTQQNLDRFVRLLHDSRPTHVVYTSIEMRHLDFRGFRDFKIRKSKKGTSTALILPDIATCPACLREIKDPKNRRFRYPFTNCTHCGPRYSIITKIPYDRVHTTMQKFKMCQACRKEYHDPGNRRFHAQPNACPKCGPHVELMDKKGKTLKTEFKALQSAAQNILSGKILALKGLGGFQFLVDARNEKAIKRLRERKKRARKPFAVLYPNLSAVKKDCFLNKQEQALLLSAQSPIVLLKKRSRISVNGDVAPQNPYLGVMLPYTPLHHILMDILKVPVIATSGNVSEEPICIDEKEALESLKKITDAFLVHNRPIVRPVDDSIARIINGKEMILRRARGYAPLPIQVGDTQEDTLAYGPQLKNTIAISKGKYIFLSQHIGDLENFKALSVCRKNIADLKGLYDFTPKQIACDIHPGYNSTKLAKKQSVPCTFVQHHLAHVLSCMAENELAAPALGVSWDGTGYGMDGSIWGSEFLLIEKRSFKRLSHFENFPLPGGEKAIDEPWRATLGLLYSIYGEEFVHAFSLKALTLFDKNKVNNLCKMIKAKINSPMTCSVGRIFDCVSALLNICPVSQFEGEAAMMLEFAIENKNTKSFYPQAVKSFDSDPGEIKLRPLLDGILSDLKAGKSTSLISAKFHNTLVELIIRVAQKSGCKKVVLTGGCFQNKYLLERSLLRLKEVGFKADHHQRIPCNDGGIALGQIVALNRKLRYNI